MSYKGSDDINTGVKDPLGEVQHQCVDCEAGRGPESSCNGLLFDSCWHGEIHSSTDK